MREKPPILVVDDEPAIRKMIVEILGLEGYPTATAIHGQDALAFLARHPGKYVIVLGIMMPVMTGLEMLERLEQDPDERAKHKIILCSAMCRLEVSRYVSVEGRLPKPFTVDQLIE